MKDNKKMLPDLNKEETDDTILITCQALKFSEHLNKLPVTHFLNEVYEVDKSLHHEGYKNW